MRSEDDNGRDDLPISTSSSDDRWPGCTRELAARMNSNYWSHPAKRKCDAISEFYSEFDIENERRANFGEDPLARPARQTLMRWINLCENFWSWRSKFGEAAARDRYGVHDHTKSA